MRQFLRLAHALLFAVAGAAFAQPQQAPVQDLAPPQDETQQQRSISQPGNNAPVWREVQSGTPNFTSIPGRETTVLIQPQARFPGQQVRSTAGEAWRQFRNGPVTFIGGWLVVLVLAAIVGFYMWKGPLRLHEPPSGRLMTRFSTLDMVVHWTVAISFAILGLSGLIMLFGKHVLLPVIGYTLFGWLTALAKNLHNFIAPLFIVSVSAMVVLFIKDNLPRSYDWQFLKDGWAVMTGAKHVPTGKYNAGEKLWFWGGAVCLSIVVTWTGLILLFPNFDQTRAIMQDAWVWHASAALLYISISFGHIYLGTLGVQGAYGNMRTGYSDETWAKEHHEIWYREMKAKGAGSAARGGAVPAGAPHMEEKG